MRRAMVGALGTAAAVLGTAAPAGAAVRGGAVNDPAEGSRADVARAEVRYDDASGALELLLTLHKPVTGDPPTFSWLLSAARTGSGSCDLAAESLGVEATLEPGVAVVRLPDERRVPATVELSGTTARIVAADPALVGLPVGCAQLLTATGDEVPGFAVGPGGTTPPPNTDPGPGAPGGGSGTGGGSGSGTSGSGTSGGTLPPLGSADYRLSKATITSKRLSPRRVRVTARTQVCGPQGKIRLRIRYRLARGKTLTKARTVKFDLAHTSRCQTHRAVWRVKVARAAKYDVRATLGASLLAPPASARGA